MNMMIDKTITRPPEPAPTLKGPLTHPENAERLATAVRRTGALLHTLNGAVPAASLASSVQVSLTELDDIPKHLNSALEPAGLHVRELNEMVSLAATAYVATAEVRKLTREQLARTSMTITQALMLYRAAEGRLARKAPINKSTSGNPDQVTRGSLLNAGLVETTDSGGVELAADVRYSLLLDT